MIKRPNKKSTKYLQNLLKKEKYEGLNKEQTRQFRTLLDKHFKSLSCTSDRINEIQRLCQINKLRKFKSKKYSNKILESKTPKELEDVLKNDFNTKIETIFTDKGQYEKYILIEDKDETK